MNLFCCQIMAPSTRITRKWEVFAGRNKFYCDGLLMSAPHTGVFYLTCFLITGTSALFFVFDCPYLASRITPFIPIIGAVLYFFTMSSLLRTTFTDPGIIPRASHDEAAYIEKQIEVPNSLNSPTYRPPPRTKEVLVKDQVVKLKYCFTCKIFRPPRASHCSLCDNCVDRFDHHCPWVGNCVGKRNYRFFYMFLVSLAFLAVFIFSCSITHLVLLMKIEKEIWSVIKAAPSSVIVTVICFFSIWSVIGLAGFHTYLTTSDQTTNEDLKGSFSSRGGQRAVNPYSRGNICLNCVHILCGPMTPSLIDRRGIVTDDFMLQMQHYSPSHPMVDIPTIQTPTMQQPTIGGADVLKPLPRLFDETHSASGMYRHRSVDNLQNGNSNSLATLVDNEIPLSTLESGMTQNNIHTNSLTRSSMLPKANLYHSSGNGNSHHPALSPIVSVPTSNSSAIVFSDDENMDTSVAILPNNKNNLSGSYNNLFKDNLDNSCSEYLLENIVTNDNDIVENRNLSSEKFPKLQQSITIHDIAYNSNNCENNQIQKPSHSITLQEINLNRIPSNFNYSNELQQQTSSTTSSTSTIPQTTQIIDSHNNIPASVSTRRIVQLQQQNVKRFETENFYSNIPNSSNVPAFHVTNPSTTAIASDLNKSDPSLHLYSNLIEEHQAEQQRQEILSKQNRHSEPLPQQQQLILKFEKNKVTTATTKQSHPNDLKNNVSVGKILDTNKIQSASTPSSNTVKSNMTSKKQRKSSGSSNSNKIAITEIEKETEPNKSTNPVNTLPSTLLSDDLDLDDPISAFVANSKNAKHQSSRKSKQNKKSQNNNDKIIRENELTAVGGITRNHNKDEKSSKDSNNRLKHLHDTTMIDTELDLDSLDGTSIGLVKSGTDIV